MYKRQGILYLRDRAKVYLAWAETAQGDDLGWTKTILREIGKTAKVLEGTELPDQFDTKAQAELFLEMCIRDRSTAVGTSKISISLSR